jgi:hypothetical protein
MLRQLLGNTSQAGHLNLYGWAMIQKIANKFVGEISVEVFENEIEPHYKGLDDDFAYFCL